MPTSEESQPSLVAAPQRDGSKGLWHLWKTYLWRWLLLGAIGAALQPVYEQVDQFWEQKLYQALFGLLFGLVCWAAFTPLQNLVNTPRVRWKSWLTVIGVWIGVKLLYFAFARAA